MFRTLLRLGFLALLCISVVQAKSSELTLAQEEITEILDTLVPALHQHYVLADKITAVQQ